MVSLRLFNAAYFKTGIVNIIYKHNTIDIPANNILVVTHSSAPIFLW